MRLTAAVWLQEFEALGDATTGASGAIDPDFARSSYTKHFLKQPTLQECANRAGQQASVQHTCPLLRFTLSPSHSTSYRDSLCLTLTLPLTQSFSAHSASHSVFLTLTLPLTQSVSRSLCLSLSLSHAHSASHSVFLCSLWCRMTASAGCMSKRC
jgi:hypothetical protein